MAQYIMYDDLTVLKEKFILKNLPFYFVCDSHNNILFSNETESDIDAAAQMLVNDLKDIRKESQIIFNIKALKAVPKGGFKKTTESDTLLTFRRKQDYQSSDPAPSNYFNNAILQKLDAIQSSNDELKQRIAMLEIEEDEEEAPEQPQSILGAIVANPSFQEVLINLITNISANLLTKQPPRVLAGTADDLGAIIERLISKGVTIDDLQKLSNMPNDKITMLLTILRSN